jgi:hypothetical protein
MKSLFDPTLTEAERKQILEWDQARCNHFFTNLPTSTQHCFKCGKIQEV